MRSLLSSAPSWARTRPSGALAVLAAAALVLVAAPSASAAGRAPVGSLDAVTTGTGSVTVSGWALDLDSSSPIQVHVYAGGTFIGAVVANGRRPDVAAAVGGTGAAGFSGTFAVAEGTYDICAYAIDPSGLGPNPAVGCTRTTVRNAVPRGVMDSVVSLNGNATVSGWALDPDTTASIEVHAYLDGSFVGATRATASRPDIGSVFGLGDSHGFGLSFTVPDGTHRLCVYGINVPAGANPLLSCTTVAGRGSATPVGHVDAYTSTQGSLSVAGWALDADTTAPIAVHVYVDGAFATSGSASTSRPDIAAAFGLGAEHGYTFTAPAAAGIHRVCVYAINTPSGANPLIGCSTVVVPGAPESPAPAPSGRTVIDGDLNVTTPGAVIDAVDVRGYVRIKAANVTIKNSIVRGRPGLTTGTGLVTNLDGFTGLVIADTELYAADPTPNINGFMGYNATLLRVNIHDVVDSIHLTGGNVLVDSSWLHNNLHYDQDPNWNGGPSHDDNVQIQQGSNIAIRNSVLSGSKNAAIMVTQDRGQVTGLTVSGNKLDNGACTINLAEKTYGPIAATVTNNAFGTGQVYKYCGIKATTTTSSVSSIVANTFSDGRTFSVTP